MLPTLIQHTNNELVDKLNHDEFIIIGGSENFQRGVYSPPLFLVSRVSKVKKKKFVMVEKCDSKARTKIVWIFFERSKKYIFKKV